MKKYIVLTIFIILLAILTLFAFRKDPTPQSQSDLTNYQDDDTLKLTYNEDNTLNLTVARSENAKSRGLMFIEEPLESNEGMIFIYDDMDQRTFWMKNTYIPLDIIFLDENLQVVKIHENTKINQTSEVYPSEKQTQYIIEVNGGWSEENGLEVGESLSLI